MAHRFMVIKRHGSGGLLGSCVGLVLTLLMLLSSPVAHAEAEIAETKDAAGQEQLEAIIKNEGNGLCLDGFGGADGELGDRPYFFHCNPANPYQQWVVSFGPSGNVVYHNVGNGLCLDRFGGADGALGDRPYFYHCNVENPYQRWDELFL